MNQLTDRSVGKPCNLVIAAKVPENAIVVNTGINMAGTNDEGKRRMLRRTRTASAHELRIDEDCRVSCGVVEVDIEVVLIVT